MQVDTQLHSVLECWYLAELVLQLALDWMDIEKLGQNSDSMLDLLLVFAVGSLLELHFDPEVFELVRLDVHVDSGRWLLRFEQTLDL